MILLSYWSQKNNLVINILYICVYVFNTLKSFNMKVHSHFLGMITVPFCLVYNSNFKKTFKASYINFSLTYF